MKKVITGLKPTGEQLMIGNLLGAILPFQKLAKGNDAAIFLADLHALNQIKDSQALQTNSMEILTEYLAILGADTPITIFKQSDIRQLPLLQWILTGVTPLSLMLRAHTYKDAKAKNEEINMGAFNYPILMAADILGYDFEIVPVGKDQKQHVEMARDIAKAFNSTYKTDSFVIPKEYIDKTVGTIPGLDGRKMSKSYGNTINLFDDEKTLKKNIMSIPTDSTPLEEPKNPDTCNVFSLIKFFGNKTQVEEIRIKYLAGNYGYGHAKMALLDMVTEYLKPYQERYIEIKKHPEFLEKKLEEGAKIMNARMDKKIAQIKEIVGLS